MILSRKSLLLTLSQVLAIALVARAQTNENPPVASAPESPAPAESPRPEAPMPVVEGDKASQGGSEDTQGIAAPVPPPATATVETLLPPSTAASTPTGNVTINLIHKLVQRGILTREEADDMIRQAEAEAEAVRAQSQTDMVAIAQAAAVQVVASSTPESDLPAASPEDIRVTHIPQPVKDQIKEEIKLELATSRTSKELASTFKLPKWVENFDPTFDLRVRYSGTFFPTGNDSFGAFPNFNAINTGLPFNTTGNVTAPQINVSENRNQYLLRARFGGELTMSDNIIGAFRVATGNNNSPVSTNQSLGATPGSTGQGGDFSKYSIWLDRAFLRYDFDLGEAIGVTGFVGRFENPFFSTRLIWDEDLGFDGVALKVKGDVTDDFQLFSSGGAFPVYNTDFNLSSNTGTTARTLPSYDKYLFGAQGGFEWEIAEDWKWKSAVAFYSFYNIEGKLSSPGYFSQANDVGDTDNTRPSFAQKGNTYMALRDILPDPSGQVVPEYQYYGLATKFNNLALTSQLDYDGFEPVRVSLIGEYVQNLAFNKADINNVAVNNRGALDEDNLTDIGDFEGSPYGWLVDLRVGTPALAKRWDWLMFVGYRYIGSDSVVDGFNDSDFGSGGTNMQGFTAGGFLSLSENVYLGVRWMGAESIAGPQADSNIFYFQIDSKF